MLKKYAHSLHNGSAAVGETGEYVCTYKSGHVPHVGKKTAHLTIRHLVDHNLIKNIRTLHREFKLDFAFSGGEAVASSLPDFKRSGLPLSNSGELLKPLAWSEL